MDIKDLRKMTLEELSNRKSELVLEFKKLKILLKQGDVQASNINKVRSLKVEIARISTIISEKFLLEN